MNAIRKNALKAKQNLAEIQDRAKEEMKEAKKHNEARKNAIEEINHAKRIDEAKKITTLAPKPVESLKKYEETNSHTPKKKEEETEYKPVFECDNGDGISLDKTMAVCGSGKKMKLECPNRSVVDNKVYCCPQCPGGGSAPKLSKQDMEKARTRAIEEMNEIRKNALKVKQNLAQIQDRAKEEMKKAQKHHKGQPSGVQQGNYNQNVQPKRTNAEPGASKNEERTYEPIFACKDGIGISLTKEFATCDDGEQMKLNCANRSLVDNKVFCCPECPKVDLDPDLSKPCYPFCDKNVSPVVKDTLNNGGQPLGVQRGTYNQNAQPKITTTRHPGKNSRKHHPEPAHEGLHAPQARVHQPTHEDQQPTENKPTWKSVPLPYGENQGKKPDADGGKNEKTKKKHEQKYTPIFECPDGSGISLDEDIASCTNGKKVKLDCANRSLVDNKIYCCPQCPPIDLDPELSKSCFPFCGEQDSPVENEASDKNVEKRRQVYGGGLTAEAGSTVEGQGQEIKRNSDEGKNTDYEDVFAAYAGKNLNGRHGDYSYNNKDRHRGRRRSGKIYLVNSRHKNPKLVSIY